MSYTCHTKVYLSSFLSSRMIFLLLKKHTISLPSILTLNQRV